MISAFLGLFLLLVAVIDSCLRFLFLFFVHSSNPWMIVSTQSSVPSNNSLFFFLLHRVCLYHLPEVRPWASSSISVVDISEFLFYPIQEDPEYLTRETAQLSILCSNIWFQDIFCSSEVLISSPPPFFFMVCLVISTSDIPNIFYFFIFPIIIMIYWLYSFIPLVFSLFVCFFLFLLFFVFFRYKYCVFTISNYILITLLKILIICIRDDNLFSFLVKILK